MTPIKFRDIPTGRVFFRGTGSTPCVKTGKATYRKAHEVGREHTIPIDEIVRMQRAGND